MSQTKSFIILTHRKSEDGAVRIDPADEVNFVFANYFTGPIKSVHSRGDGPGSFIELTVDTEEEAHALARELPAVKAGIEKAIVIPLQPYAPFIALAEAWD